jgi:adenylosuccinate synthase
MIYLSMRTNLRLLRNAQVAIKDLKSGKVKDEHTMHAYLLMMMQPFMTMDDLSVSVLSDKDKANLYKIADALPKEMRDYLGYIEKRSKVPVRIISVGKGREETIRR